jgi:hypothetical protein
MDINSKNIRCRPLIPQHLATLPVIVKLEGKPIDYLTSEKD